MHIIKLHKTSRISAYTSRFLILSFILFFTAQSTFAGITKGPLLLSASKDKVALVWETDIAGEGKVCYGIGDKLENQIITQSQPVEYEIKEKGEPDIIKTVFIHKLWIPGLKAGRSYTYNVAGPRQKSGNYKFRTTPARTDKVRFAVYGDNRTHPDKHRAIVEQIIKAKVDFVVNSGDLVTRGHKYEQWGQQFFDPLKGLAESVPIYPAKGNHDKSKQNYFEQLLIPPGQGNDFGFDYGPVHYYCLDNVTEGRTDEQGLNLIADDMRNSKAIWKFVSYHKPSLNFGGHWSRWADPNALSVLAKVGADFVVTGHSHIYERFRPIAPPRDTKGSFVTYITSGGGGAEVYDVERCFYHADAKAIRHFCLFNIDGNKLTLDVIDIDGNVIDHLELAKTWGKLNRKYRDTAVPAEAARFYQNLRAALNTPPPQKAQKNQPFTVTYKLATPALKKPGKITFKFRSQAGNYILPEPKTIVIPTKAGTINAEFRITPLVKIKRPVDKYRKPKPIVPELLVDCHYQIGEITDDVTFPVVIKSKKPKKR